MKRTIFTLTSARSGTVYLRHLFQNNVPNCACRHEPFFDWGNPTMFGRAIYDAHAGRLDRLRRLLLKKRRYVERLPGQVYLESSHAFLKSTYRVALEIFPELRLVHLIRDPLKVARSEAYREVWRRRIHAPFHYYRGDDQRRHFVWSLTGNEEIFRPFQRERLTLFQWYLLEWIEIENRAMRFLEEHQLNSPCYTLHVPTDLNNPERIKAMFDFFGLATLHPVILLQGRKNRSLGYSRQLTPDDEAQCDEILSELPSRYLEIFEREPYMHCAWARRFCPGTLKSVEC
jgi:hypothetical protein